MVTTVADRRTNYLDGRRTPWEAAKADDKFGVIAELRMPCGLSRTGGAIIITRQSDNHFTTHQVGGNGIEVGLTRHFATFKEAWEDFGKRCWFQLDRTPTVFDPCRKEPLPPVELQKNDIPTPDAAKSMDATDT